MKTRVAALQESFYPTVDVLYSAVVNRMANLLGIVDRLSVLAYLGRPAHETETPMDQTVQYLGSGVVVRKRHKIRKRLAARKGYIEFFNLGYVYVAKNEWFIHWNHTTQETLTLQQDDEASHQKRSIDYFSLSPIGDGNTTPKDVCEVATHIETVEKREEYSLCERNLVHLNNESNANFSTALKNSLLRTSREPG